MVIVSDLEPFYNFQAQSTVFVFIQRNMYTKSTVYLKPFLVFQPK